MHSTVSAGPRSSAGCPLEGSEGGKEAKVARQGTRERRLGETPTAPAQGWKGAASLSGRGAGTFGLLALLVLTAGAAAQVSPPSVPAPDEATPPAAPAPAPPPPPSMPSTHNPAATPP